MPASTKKVTTKKTAKRAASLEKGVAKNKAANAAKRAKVAAKAKPVAKAKRAPVTALGAIRQEIAEKAAAKATKPAKAPTMAATDKANGTKRDTAEAKGVGSVSGSKATILNMIETTKGGVSAAEIAKKLGWPRAGGTISRAIKLASFKVAKVRDAEGVLRYSRA